MQGSSGPSLTNTREMRRYHAHRASLRARRLNLRPPGGGVEDRQP